MSKYLPLDNNIFIQNRKRFMAKMQPNSIAIFVSNDEFPLNGDALHHFQQNSDLFWLSGIEQEGSMVILFPNNPDPKYREVLVLTRPQELKEIWDGKRLRANEATAICDKDPNLSSTENAPLKAYLLSQKSKIGWGKIA